jgi:hypothetical protein
MCINSIVDVITNSSSELFICDTDKPVGVVRQLLVGLLYLYNRQFETDYAFEQVFKEPKMESLRFILDYYYLGSSYKASLAKRVEEKDEQVLIIESESDNTIPYEMFDWIERLFNACRSHQG